MQLEKEIKKHRLAMKLSQEELAEKLYVSRQSISNWETGKNYPDIHSLLFMSTLFNVTLEQLLKGDVGRMKTEIQTVDIKVFKTYSKVFTCLMCSMIIMIPVMVYFLDVLGIALSIVLFIVTMLVALKVEKLKKINDVQTYKEILSFMEGTHLDEVNVQREIGKRPYQKVLLILVCGLVSFLSSLLLMLLLTQFTK